MKTTKALFILLPLCMTIGGFSIVNGQSNCTAGYYVSADVSCDCVECPAGYYCPGGNETGARACPEGTYNPDQGKSDLTDCKNCLGGTYSSLPGASNCTDCVAGEFCIEGATKAEPCVTGYWSSDNDAACTICQAGYFCSSTTEIKCPSGQWSSEGQDSCEDCPAGFSCPQQMSTSQCQAGYYSSAGELSCLECDNGTYAISAGSSSCTECSAGSYCSSTTSGPVKCAIGYVSNASATICTICDSGEVSNADNTACEQCPAGSKCPSPESGAEQCQGGYYSEAGKTSCEVCTAGSSCPAGASSPTTCNPGQYSSAGQATCSDCPAGYECLNTTTKKACDSGFYSTAGATSCTECTAGSYCTSTSEIPCAEGTYSSAGWSACVSCPENHECPDKNQAVECGPGTVSAVGQSVCVSETDACSTTCTLGQWTNGSTCTDCVAGQYCPDPTATAPSNCPSGTYSSNKATSCTTCPPGNECIDQTSATACADGSYQLGGQETCTICPAGQYCPSKVQAPIDCKPGWYSTAGSTICTECEAGSSCTLTTQTACATGYHSSPGYQSCVICPAGSACPTKATEDNIVCAVGTYAIAGQTECTTCPAGSYCPSTQQATVLACPTGTVSAGNRSSCIPCGVGKYCSDPNIETQTPCDPGGYSLGYQTSCTGCPAGSYCDVVDQPPKLCVPGTYSLANATECVYCPAGHYCPTTIIASPTECEAGTYSPGNSTTCYDCQAGYKCSAGATSATPSADICDKGHYCDGETETECPVGTFLSTTGGTGKDSCTPCTAGNCCEVSGLTAATTVCPAGHYCPTGTGACKSFACPAGTYNNDTGKSSETDCTTCSAGNYCNEGATAETTCPQGYYCVEGQSSRDANPCPAGTYGNDTGYTDGNECTACPEGFYCPYGYSENPMSCPAGTYNNETGKSDKSECKPCEPGKACTQSGLSAPDSDCEEGYYCPKGTSSSNTYPCGYGSYTNRTDLSDSTQCDVCPEGYYCELGTSGFSGSKPPKDCGPGFYCPFGTQSAIKYPCPRGTFSPNKNNAKPEDCTDCTPGYYCIGGEATVSGICQPGYYCLLGTTFAYEYACPNGTWNNQQQQDELSDCSDCTQGHYCEEATVNPIPCPLGTYMPFGYDSATTQGETAKDISDCIECPGGYKCLTGYVNPEECGLGQYSKPGNSECNDCLPGYYCDNVTTSYDAMINDKQCPPGSYCGGGVKYVSESTPCSPGYYCPQATPIELPCQVGTVNTEQGKANVTDCLPCDAGSYCLENSSRTTDVCQAGYYCPTNIPNVFGNTPSLIGSYGPYQVPCPEGTYRNSTGATVVEDCDICPEGFYCPIGTFAPIKCSLGFYCLAGTGAAPTPCPPGSYGTDEGLVQVEDCKDCDPGYYCSAYGKSSYEGKCDAGYLCYGNATVSNPTDGITGEPCPAGGYCPAGSYIQEACPAGTYSNSSKQTDERDCKLCPAGFYCSNAKSPEPTGPCSAGFFCKQGSYSEFQNNCSSGMYCPEGSPEQSECPIGSYQDQPISAKCKPCPPGRTCPFTGMSYTLPCPKGSFCESPNNDSLAYDPNAVDYLGTSNENGELCKDGFYNPNTDGEDESACLPCPQTYYCSGRGLSNVTGKCSAGYICYNASFLQEPTQDNSTGFGTVDVSQGQQCLPGKYCIEGATHMRNCPQGTYNPNSGGRSIDDCRPCDAGKYCDGQGLSEPNGSCADGYYCKGGASSPTPQNESSEGGDQCKLGQYCKCAGGCSHGTDCPVGMYADERGLSICKNCNPGFFCPLGATSGGPCVAGKYCVGSFGNSTDVDTRDLNDVPDPCEAGTYSNETDLSSQDQCHDCTAGMCCDIAGLTEPNKQIIGGYFSDGRARKCTPTDPSDCIGYQCGICPLGFYCKEGSTTPKPCKVGTLGQRTGLDFEGQCQDCPGGSFCNQTGLSQPSGDCAPGYYCSGSSEVPNPELSTGWGGPCRPGYYCIAGSFEEKPCEPGSYNAHEKQESCIVCPAGFYCESNVSNPVDCPAGHYCPNGTTFATENECPVGTFNNQTNAQSVSDCLPCPPGKYCDSRGLEEPRAECDQGWYCKGSSTSSKPTNSDEGGSCQRGEFCPKGSSEPHQCLAGMYCDTVELAYPTGNCTEGFYCSGGSIFAEPTDGITGDICPSGNYCPGGSSVGTKCPPGTFVSGTGSKELADCKECTPGKYCKDYGMESESGDCSAGYYCPGGQDTGTPTSYICSPGYFCINGSSMQSACGNGTYQDEPQQSYCKTCQAGHYCDASSGPVISYNDTLCPAGHYCPDGTSFQYEYPCAPGTYNDQEGSKTSDSCVPCQGSYYCPSWGQASVDTNLKCAEGYFCASGASSATPEDGATADICPKGFFCPEGTITPERCPPGSFSNKQKLANIDQCQACPAGQFCGEYNLTDTSGDCWEGFYCDFNSTKPNQVPCPIGYFCTAGTPVLEPCPIGTFSNQTGLGSSENCTLCTAGYYCDALGLTEPTNKCKEGFYCLEGSTDFAPNETYCKINQHCPTGSVAPLSCIDGYYVSVEYAANCTICPAGSYCLSGTQPKDCPMGQYCPVGTGKDPIDCPRGTMSSETGLKSANDCTVCPSQYFCDGTTPTMTTGFCDAGYYCVFGVDRPNPDGDNSTSAWQCFDGAQTGYGGECPVGSYCPVGSELPTPCKKGTYSNFPRAENCSICVAGYYCEEGTGDYTAFPCPVGHYCEEGTSEQFQFPCPRGTYNEFTNKNSSDDCIPCTGGMYCPNAGTEKPILLCPPGYYCPEGSDDGFANSCGAGEFCPEGSPQPTPCTAGYFCDHDNAANVTGPCAAGYYCTLSAIKNNPTDGTTGNVCPAGYYCPETSISPRACPEGTYLNSTENTSPDDCNICEPRYYCKGTGQEKVTEFCEPGYYCNGTYPIKSATPAEGKCPAGHFCELGSMEPVMCESGFYQNEEGQDICKECPEGYYCDNSGGPVTIYSEVCPTGYYCPNGTKFATEFACPVSTFQNKTQTVSRDDCIPCTLGRYCEEPHLSEPTGPCAAGFFCRVGASISNPPNDGDNYGECPKGSFCVEGTSEPEKCPPGTYNPQPKGTDSSYCRDCSEGTYCPDYGMSTDGQLCEEGYYCGNGSSNATNLCPAGYYCPVGANTPRPCLPGTWSDQEGLTSATECYNCTAGYFCPSSGQTEVTDICEEGYYCLEGQSSSKNNPCPRGMVCPIGSEFYKMCGNGTYTNTTHQFECEICPERYYCVPPSTPAEADTNVQICPLGYYCPLGTGFDWKPCPSGTYSNKTLLSSIEECTQCDGGDFCNGLARTNTNGPCSAGYYCTIGVNEKQPVNGSLLNESCSNYNTGQGGICPVGHFCIEGSITSEPCKAGYYSDQPGAEFCSTCQAGYFCPPETSNYLLNPCPAGYVCPNGTEFGEQYPCPAGTYNPLTTRSSEADDCLACDAGEYCGINGLNSTSGLCSGGYYCISGSTSNKPTIPSEGGECQPGYYCKEGSSTPLSCPTGTFCGTAGLSEPTGNCSSGFYCFYNASVPEPRDGITGWPCPAGSFCVSGTQSPEPCHIGTFSNTEELQTADQCEDCTPGSFCATPGLREPTGLCASGYYCPGKDLSNTSIPCSPGYECIEGSDKEKPCDSGYYQDETASSFCKDCPPGCVCDSRSGPAKVSCPVTCPSGYYCDQNTKTADQSPCPLGTFFNGTGAQSIDFCLPCLAKFACDETGLEYPYRLCSEGYFCRKGANSTTPDNGSDANVCPAGYYCPEGTAEPFGCPIGTFSNQIKLNSSDECTQCTAGSYCDQTAQTSVRDYCNERYYCPTGSKSATEIECTEGNFCPQGSPDPEPCKEGTYSNSKGLASSVECLTCIEGFYCAGIGRTNVSGKCDEGYYCPNGSTKATQITCPIGTFCVEQSATYKICPDGTYAPTAGLGQCLPCPAGYYCLSSNVIPGDETTISIECPQGKYCTEGTGPDYLPCPPGTFSDQLGLHNMSECETCLGGSYCSGHGNLLPTEECREGFYCKEGVSIPDPVSLDGKCNVTTESGRASVGDICPVGFYCPAGASQPEPCKKGYYADVEGMASCLTCPAGYYCPDQTSFYLANECPKGYYCLNGTEHANQYPCDPGTFNNVTTASNESFCLPCTPGMYCEGFANTEPTEECPGGYYCPGGVAGRTDGRLCEVGYYCPQGSEDHIPCPPGKYCCCVNKANYTGDCQAGYYCNETSSNQQSEDCPIGHYCTEGIEAPAACQNGTYNSDTNGESFESCQQCDKGSYCSGTALSAVTGPCADGYYCDGGQSSPNDPVNACPAGHRCPSGDPSAPISCEFGLFQDKTTQSTCKTCPEGHYCSDGPVITPSVCESGYYCLQGTSNFETPCPPKTFNNNTGSISEDACVDCLAGYFCATPGRNTGEGDGPCQAGFYCESGSDRSDQYECPSGYYCEEASPQPIPCPIGSKSQNPQAKSKEECDLCDPGYYCNENTSINGNPCDAGFVCVLGAFIPNPNDNVTGYICPVGSACEVGSSIEQNCEKGFYQDLLGQKACKPCTEGFYCPDTNMANPIICPVGKYCPLQTSNPPTCIAGTYSDTPGLKRPEDCLPCPAGRYCDGSTGDITSVKNCTAGFLCVENSTQATPDGTDGVNGECPPGYYCLQGTETGTECPPGTMRNTTRASDPSGCFPCDAGKFCTGPAATHASGDCMEGYYCPKDEIIDTSEPTGFECPTGSFCVSGSANPESCPPKTYQPNIKSSACLQCEPGFYCQTNTTVPVICPQSNYCPAGVSAPIPCPDGTFTAKEGLNSSSKCAFCTTGSYCRDGSITEKCTAGYICRNGSSSPTPNEPNFPPEVGSLCPFGYYCLAGTSEPEACPPGLFINSVGATSENNCTTCPEGYICTNNSLPESCTPGYYCPFDEPIQACPQGTFSPTEGATDISTCQLCTPGYYCDEEGLASPVKPCPVGHYCPAGTGSIENTNSTVYLEPVPCPAGTYRQDVKAAEVAECRLCRAGYYCPNATTICFNCSDTSISGIACESGMYCPEGSATYHWCPASYYCSLAETKTPCPAGYYCGNATAEPAPCPPGHYCPYMSSIPIQCPLGYKETSGSLRQSFEDTCEPCRAGTYGADEDRQNCTECRAGVICLETATTDQPDSSNTTLNETNSFACPRGYYCLAGAKQATPCPLGTFNDQEYGESELTACTLCPVDYFSNLLASTACFSCGGDASQPNKGQSTCQCSGTGRDFQPSDKQCPCSSRYNSDVSRDGDCIELIYDICPLGTSRYENGSCFTEQQWQEQCIQVCGANEYIGYDSSIGACKCQTDDLNSVCDHACQIQQKESVVFGCPSVTDDIQSPYIRLSDGTLYYTNLLNIINAENAISSDQCTFGVPSTQPVFISTSEERGFVGAYQPSPVQTSQLLQDNAKQVTLRRKRSLTDSDFYSIRTSSNDHSIHTGARRLLADSDVLDYFGILNPVMCIQLNTLMLFSVSNANYPVYDTNSLYNSNFDFDYGGFRELQEYMELTQSNTTLFAFKFTDAGLYVFMLSSNNNKKMYIRVLGEGGACTETGPYLPPTPLYMIQSGVTLNSDILLEPDWVMIAILIVSSIIIILLLIVALILFEKYGWMKNSFLVPYYRNVSQAFNLDDYSSKGSTVHSVKKFHRNMGAAITTEAVGAQSVTAEVEDEFWDSERQVDMEAFSSQHFYKILEKQSHGVTSSVSRQNDEVKSLYQKIGQQTQSLKDLWVAKLNLRGRASLATAEELSQYERKKEEIDIELGRRKLLGDQFQDVLNQQREIMNEDDMQRHKHLIAFNALHLSASRLLKQTTKALQEGTMNPEEIKLHITGHAGIIINKMRSLTTLESERVGAWGLLRDPTGAKLINKDKMEQMEKDEIFSPEGNLLVSEAICVLDNMTGLVQPADGALMMLANGQTIPIPKNQYFVHPQTGRVLPVDGNVCYDPISSRIIYTADLVVNDSVKSAQPLLPFIMHPVDHAGKCINVNLPHVERRLDLYQNAPIIEPLSGLTVPTLAVTINKETGNLHPVGGTYISPITTLLTPIEIGSIMIDQMSGRPVPIQAIGFDKTGKVIPLGGTMMSQSGDNNHIKIPILNRDVFTEPLSGKKCRVNSSRLLSLPNMDETVMPCAGGYEALLDSTLLARELDVIDALNQYKHALSSQEMLDQGVNFSTKLESNQLENSIKNYQLSSMDSEGHRLRELHNLLRREERAAVLSATGGASGMMEFAATGQLLPILVGTTMVDPSGTNYNVPILCIDKDRQSGTVLPVGGTMEDVNGGGLVPIIIGRQAVDHASGKAGKVVGAKVNSETGTVVPVVQTGSLVHKRTRKPAPGAVAMLEEEIAARRGFWRRQRQREIELDNRITQLTENLSSDFDSLSVEKIEDNLEGISDTCESELSAVLPPDVMSIMRDNDEEEKLVEESSQADYNKLVEVVRSFVRKLQLEDTRKAERMAETNSITDPMAKAVAMDTVVTRYHQSRKRIQLDLLSHLDSKMESFSMALSSVGVTRDISELLSAEARELLKGSSIVAGDYETVFTGVYGDDIQVSGQSEIIPLLKQLIALLESGISFQLAPEMLTALQQTQTSQQRVQMLQALQAATLQQQQQLQQARMQAGGVSGNASVQYNAMGQPINQYGAVGGQPGQGQQVTQEQMVQAAKGKQFTVQERTVPGKADKVVTIDGVEKTVSDGFVADKDSLRKAFQQRRMSSRMLLDNAAKLQENVSAEIRDMMERHAIEIAQLENELRSEEIAKINEIISDVEEKKKREINKLKMELKEKLKNCKTDEEKQQVMLEYATKIRDVTEKYEREKQTRLAALRKNLAKERQRRKQELYNKQVQEAEHAGLDPSKVVTDITSEDEEEVNKDLLLLAKQQEALIAQLQKAFEEDDSPDADERKRKLDQEMEERMRALNAGRASVLMSEDDLQQLKEKDDADNKRRSNLHANIKDKMKLRRAQRRSSRRGSVLEGVDGNLQKALSEDELTTLQTTLSEIEDLNESNVQNLILSTLKEAEWESSEAQRASLIQDMLQNSDMDESERDKILAEYKALTGKMEKQLNSEKESQKQKMLAKLAARKKLKEDIAKEQAVAKQMKKVTAGKATEEGTEERMKMKANVASVMDKIEKSDKKNTVEAELEQQVEALAELNQKHLEEQNNLQASLEQQEEEEAKNIEAILSDQSEQQLAAATARAQAEAEEKNLTEKQTQKLIKHYHKQAEALNKSLSHEKDRQLNQLKERMRMKKQKKEKQLAQKQEAEFAKEMVELKNQRMEAGNMESIEAERRALVEYAANEMKPGELAIDKFVQEILLPRHLKEVAELADLIQREVEAIKIEAKAMADAERDQIREQMMGRQLQEIQDFLLQHAGEPASKIMKKKQELEKKHQAELQSFHEDSVTILESAEASAALPLAMQHAQRKLQLREKHVQELADTMSNLDPEQALIQQYSEEAAKMAKEAQKIRERKTREMEEKIAQLKAERRRKDEEDNKDIRTQIAAFERELSEDILREQARQNNKMDERHKADIDAEEKRAQEIMNDANLNQDEKDRLLQEHDENLKRMKSRMADEKQRANAELQRKLEERRRRRKEAKMSELHENASVSKAQHEKEEAAAMQQIVDEGTKQMADTEQLLKMQQDLPTGEQPLETLVEEPPTLPPVTGMPITVTSIPIMASGGVADWSTLLLNSPVFQELEIVKENLQQYLGSGMKGGIDGADSTPFIDIKDAQWMLEGKLVPMDMNKLKASQFVVYRFGVFIAKMLEEVLDTEEVNLLLASSLPSNNYNRNAFRRSFYLQRDTTLTLFIRADRLSSVGDFMMAIMHCIAHISVGQMENDADPYFLRAFYKAMKTTCEDLFFARARAAKKSIQNMQDYDTTAIDSASSLQQKIDILEDLVEVKVFIPSSKHFSADNRKRRMANFDEFNKQENIKKALRKKHKTIDATNIDQKLKDLHGLAGAIKRPQVTSAKEAIKGQVENLKNELDDLNSEVVASTREQKRISDGLDGLRKRHVKGNQLNDVSDKLRKVELEQQLATEQASALNHEIKRKEKST